MNIISVRSRKMALKVKVQLFWYIYVPAERKSAKMATPKVTAAIRNM